MYFRKFERISYFFNLPRIFCSFLDKGVSNYFLTITRVKMQDADALY